MQWTEDRSASGARAVLLVQRTVTNPTATAASEVRTWGPNEQQLWSNTALRRERFLCRANWTSRI
jgi:hypothetical protein